MCGICTGICVDIFIGIRVGICVGISTETQGNHRQPPNTEQLKSNYPSKETQEQCFEDAGTESGKDSLQESSRILYVSLYGEDSREEAPQATTEHRVAKI